MDYVVEAKNLNKAFGKQQVLAGIDLTISAGEIVGVIGANGAGKSTLLKSILGLTRANGQLTVCGLDPINAQHELMNKVSFVADTAILPKWITPNQLFSYTKAVHPHFNQTLAEQFIEQSQITPNQKVKKMSKGMITQLHLALAIAIDSDLLVLDEPTLGLDILRRKHFYEQLLEDHFDENNTVIITTHQIEEIENIITRLVYIDGGNITLDIQVDTIAERFAQLTIMPTDVDAVQALQPISTSATLSGVQCIFDGVDTTQLEQYGTVTTPNLSNIVAALMELQHKENSDA